MQVQRRFSAVFSANIGQFYAEVLIIKPTCVFVVGDMTQAEQFQHAQVQMALMRAIPCMAMHPTALPFVQRALMPFSQQGNLSQFHSPKHATGSLHTYMCSSVGCAVQQWPMVQRP